ncbi:MAG: HEAT repeat domain-containing protein [Polyangiaceae bacterium]|nr:HEAT repeat domain-containing protein [Polyangiaceae bacterium]
MSRSWPAVALAVLLLARPTVADPGPPSDADAVLDAEIARLRGRYLRDREAAEKAIAALGEAAVPRVAALLADTDPRVQRAAVAILGSIGTVAAIRPLIPLLDHPDESIASSVRGSLLRAGNRVRPALTEALKDQTLGEDALAAVQELIDASIGTEIEEVFARQFTANGESGFYSGQFAELEGRQEEVGPVLRKMFAGTYDWSRAGANEGRFRLLAADAMGDLKIEACASDLRMAFDSGAFGSENAAFALYKMGEKGPAQEMERLLLKELEEAEGGGREATRQNLAELYARIGDYEKTIEQYRAMGDGGRRSYVNYYNTACALSMMGKKDEAVAELRKAVDQGYSNLEWLLIDGDLNGIRGEKGYREIVKDLGGTVDPENGRPLPEEPPPDGRSD